MSFWKESPGPHWSDWISSIFTCSGISLAQPIRRYPLALATSTESVIYSLAKPTESMAIVDFLSQHFKITQNAVCCLPVERLARGLQSDWIMVLAKDEGKIVGVVASRFLGSILFESIVESERKQSKYSSADYIDFFCVHPDYRKTGIGSDLLKSIDFYSSERGRPIHLFQKEITPLSSIPPLWYGSYIVRQIILGNSVNPRVSAYQHQLKRKIQPDFTISFANARASQDSRYYVNDCGNFKVHLAITNTYHMVQNAWLGEVLFYSVEDAEEEILEKNIAAAIEEILEIAGYQYILMDESIPHLKQFNWTRDASYFVYIYNSNPRKFFSVKPHLWF